MQKHGDVIVLGEQKRGRRRAIERWRCRYVLVGEGRCNLKVGHRGPHCAGDDDGSVWFDSNGYIDSLADIERAEKEAT